MLDVFIGLVPVADQQLVDPVDTRERVNDVTLLAPNDGEPVRQSWSGHPH